MPPKIAAWTYCTFPKKNLDTSCAHDLHNTESYLTEQGRAPHNDSKDKVQTHKNENIKECAHTAIRALRYHASAKIPGVFP